MADKNYMGSVGVAAKDDQFAQSVGKLVADSALYRDTLSANRIIAMQYYNGEMPDVQPRQGWSQVVSQDVRSTIKKVLPSLLRTILGNEIIAEFTGQNENDVEGAEQVTDYINLIMLPESNGAEAIHDSTHDALLLRNGILYAGIENKTIVTGSTHTGLDEISLADLVNAEGVTVLEARHYPAPPPDTDLNPQPDYLQQAALPPPQAPMQGQNPNAGQSMPPAMQGAVGQPMGQQMPMGMMPPEQSLLYDVKIKRVVKKNTVKLLAVPPEEYLIHPDATDSQVDAALVGRETRKSRSDLIAMGYDRDMVMQLPAMQYNASTDGEKFNRRQETWLQNSPDQKELEQVLYYDLYVRLDYDDDGIAELRHVCCAGDLTSKHILVNDYADFVRYFDIVTERRPHQWEGTSIPDDVIEIQRVKTALLRYAMDNTYQVVSPTKTINVDKLKNGDADAFLNPEPGRPAFVTGVDRVSDAVQYDIVPYIGDKAMSAIDYWDKQISNRTGIDDTSAGMPDDALQNVTAKATAVMEQKGIAQAEMMARTVGNCLRPVFLALFQLTIQNQDKARIVRLRGKDVQVDPRSWNADMDVRINTGLGAGTRERDMVVMQQILGIQEKLEGLYGADSPILKPENIYNAVESMVHAGGIKAVGKYFTKPTPESVAAFQQQKAAQKSPEQQKVDAQIQLLGEKSKADTANHTAKMQADLVVSNAQHQAALIIKEAEAKKMQADEYIKSLLDKHKTDSAERVAMAKIASDEAIALDKVKHDYLKHQAGKISDSIMGVEDAKKQAEQAAIDGKQSKSGKASNGKPKAMKFNITRDPKTGDMSGFEIAGTH